jgi:hypothetical protein
MQKSLRPTGRPAPWDSGKAGATSQRVESTSIRAPTAGAGGGVPAGGLDAALGQSSSRDVIEKVVVLREPMTQAARMRAGHCVKR